MLRGRSTAYSIRRTRAYNSPATNTGQRRWVNWVAIVALLAFVMITAFTLRKYGGVLAWQHHLLPNPKQPGSSLLFIILALIGASLILILWKLPVWQVYLSAGTTKANRFERENEARKTLAQIIGGLFLLVGLYSSARTLTLQTQSLETLREGQITDRYSKAVEQLGATDSSAKPKVEVRLGAIYALERIANESTDDYWPIIEVLTAYVRRNSPLSNGSATVGTTRMSEERFTGVRVPLPPPLRVDIQAALTVIARRRHHDEEDHINQVIDLSYTSLRGANLENAYLRGANLEGSDLTGAQLSVAYLWDAGLRNARLTATEFLFAELEAARLGGSKGLTQIQVDMAEGSPSTELPDGLTKPKEWLKKPEGSWDWREDSWARQHPELHRNE